MSDFNGFCSVDENGVIFDQYKQIIQSREQLQLFFENLNINDQSQVTSYLNADESLLVEIYDSPIIAKDIKLSSQGNTLTNAYGFEWNFNLQSLVVDEWDRFHGMTQNKIPFVMNREAQDRFFDQLDEFDDDSFTYKSNKYLPNNYWIVDDKSINEESYWTQKYNKNEDGWDLGEPAMGLQNLLPKLKLPSSRVLVLGGGSGHDAAHFAKQGHHVTQIDISPEAIARGKAKYGDLTNLKFIQADIFELPHSMYSQYDLVFEHTCFCAIDPNRRNDLIKQWRRLLHNNGTFLGIFFTMPKRMGPPFGASEWEIKHRLQTHFQPLIWQRFRQSIKPRLGRELLVYMQKKT